MTSCGASSVRLAVIAFASTWLRPLALHEELKQHERIDAQPECHEDEILMQKMRGIDVENAATDLTPQKDQPDAAMQSQRALVETQTMTIVANSHGVPSRIPFQVVLVAKQDSLEEVPSAHLRDNVKKMLQKNPGITVRWLGDKACEDYLVEMYDEELRLFFSKELHGPYKSDLCRAAVLAREGGFYVDLDVEPTLPFAELIDGNTTFMSAYAANGYSDRPLRQWSLLNAIMAAAPHSTIMQKHMDAIRSFYHGALTLNDGKDGKFPMGPQALMEGLLDTIKSQCNTTKLGDHSAEMQWSCGPEVVRLFHEHKLHCGDEYSVEECQPHRHGFLEYGIFAGEGPGRILVGWTRFADCKELGCTT